ncbi:hypothetical protein GS538_11870 [Rhodococcus hoagii]|nr:hypothetical protein [Prescottella equi]
MSDRDIIDDIDALVDEQMAGYRDRSGYDHNVNQDRCWHCGEDWHGLAITARMEEMRRRYRYRGMFAFGERDYAESALDPDYRYADDDSEVLCPGSDFIGPWATVWQIEMMRTEKYGALPPGVEWRDPALPTRRTRQDGPPWVRWHVGGCDCTDCRRVNWTIEVGGQALGRADGVESAGFTYHLPADVESSGHIAGAIPDGPPEPDFPPEMQFPPASFGEQLRRQRDMVRRLAEFAAVPRATYQPMQHLLVGDRVVIESGGRRQEVVVVSDPVQHPDGRIEYTTADPRFSARARALADVRDRIRRGETPLPNDSTAAEYEEMLAANGFHIEHWQRDRLRELMSWPNPFDELADRESRMAARAAESMAAFGRAALRAQEVMRGYMIPARYADRYTAELAAINASTVPAPETPQQRALPRPSHTPPMWAVQPNRRNRRRNR